MTRPKLIKAGTPAGSCFSLLFFEYSLLLPFIFPVISCWLNTGKCPEVLRFQQLTRFHKGLFFDFSLLWRKVTLSQVRSRLHPQPAHFDMLAQIPEALRAGSSHMNSEVRLEQVP